MKHIEKAKRPEEPGLTNSIRTFWSKNVNAERIMGKKLTHAQRGEEQYFSKLEEQRYRSHYHLLPWIRAIQPGSKILEIGCGIGLDSFQIARLGTHLTAIDLTQVGVETARERFIKAKISARFLVADACNLPFPDNHFDCVYSFGVLHHTANTDKSIDEVFRVLGPGGEARIMLYNRHSLNEMVHRITRIPFEERDHICPVVRRFSKKEIFHLFRSFSHITIEKEYLFGEGYGTIFRLIPRFLYLFLSHRIGWHWMIRAKK